MVVVIVVSARLWWVNEQLNILVLSGDGQWTYMVVISIYIHRCLPYSERARIREDIRVQRILQFWSNKLNTNFFILNLSKFLPHSKVCTKY